MKSLNQLDYIDDSKSIMIIDDEPHVGLFMEVVLSSRGYRVTNCVDVDDALTLFSNNPDSFKLIITDQNMPKMCGTDLSKQFLAIRSDIPIILCTGFRFEDIEQNMDKIGIVACLLKPLKANVLLQQVEDIINADNHKCACQANEK